MNALCNRPEGRNQGQNQGALQSDQAAADLLRRRSADWRSAFLFNQTFSGKYHVHIADDLLHGSGFLAGHVREEWSTSGGNPAEYDSERIPAPEEAPI